MKTSTAKTPGEPQPSLRRMQILGHPISRANWATWPMKLYPWSKPSPECLQLVWSSSITRSLTLAPVITAPSVSGFRSRLQYSSGKRVLSMVSPLVACAMTLRRRAHVLGCDCFSLFYARRDRDRSDGAILRAGGQEVAPGWVVEGGRRDEQVFGGSGNAMGRANHAAASGVPPAQ
jgi:hypothetical protein